MTEPDDSPNADESVVNQIAELLMAARAGSVVGLVAVVFRHNGDVNVLAQGDQTMLQRLGALEVAKDGCKMLATQEVLTRKPVGWGPSGTA